jgi:MYXO-CTERM domain-containing protein
MKRGLALLFALSLWPATAAAHGDVSERIAKLDARLAARPDDAALHDARGALHGLASRWDAAADDFAAARRAEPGRDGIDHRLANALLHAGDPAQAIALLDVHLERHPSHEDAYRVRGRAERALGHLGAAVADLTMALELSSAPSPEAYLERADVLVEDGDVAAAVVSLRDGIDELGPIVSLVERAVALETDGDAALALIARLTPELQASPRWRARRGDLLVAQGDVAGAASEYAEALATIARLPASRRDVRAMRDLEAEIRAKLPETAPPRDANAGAWLLVLGAVLPLRRRRRTS